MSNFSLNNFIEEAEREFNELKPTKFCGEGNHCSGLWNLECEDIKHFIDINNRENLITRNVAKRFLHSKIEKAVKEARRDEIKFLNKLIRSLT